MFRLERDGVAAGDVIARHDEEHPGRPLLERVMAGGRRLPAGRVSLDRSRERARDEIARLPEPIRGLRPADPPYPVEISAALARDRDEARARVSGRRGR